MNKSLEKGDEFRQNGFIDPFCQCVWHADETLIHFLMANLMLAKGARRLSAPHFPGLCISLILKASRRTVTAGWCLCDSVFFFEVNNAMLISVFKCRHLIWRWPSLIHRNCYLYAKYLLLGFRPCGNYASLRDFSCLQWACSLVSC